MSSLALWRHLPLVGVLAAVVGIYLPSMNDYFHGDDFIAFVDLTNKPFLRDFWDTLSFHTSSIYWRPLGQLYYRLIYEIAGFNTVAFHIANVSVFLLTLVLLYSFCLKAGFGRAVAISAAATLGLLPNHAVSVAWITNASRELAMLFFLGSLLYVQAAADSHRLRHEAFAAVLFLFAILSDETSLTLAPVLVLYPLLKELGAKTWPRYLLRRAIVYGGMVASLGPLQLIMEQSHSPQQVRSMGLSSRIFDHTWALAGKLVLPVKDGVNLAALTDAQWVAGAVAIAAALLLVVFGSGRARFLVAWTACALAPFTLWLLPIVPARYIYPAAIPFAVLASWAAVSAWTALLASGVWRRLTATPLPLAAATVVAAALVAVAFLSSRATIDRNHAYGLQTERYRVLAEQLPKALPSVPKHGRIVIYYGIWNLAPIWPESILRTLYRDPTLTVINVPPDQMDSGWPQVKLTDRVVYYTGSRFIVPAPAVAGALP